MGAATGEPCGGLDTHEEGLANLRLIDSRFGSGVWRTNRIANQEPSFTREGRVIIALISTWSYNEFSRGTITGL